MVCTQSDMNLSIIIQKVVRKWMKIRLQPIRVFCLHHVCKQFDADSMNTGDWMELSEFQDKIRNLQSQGYQFISLSKACHHIKKDYLRYRKYAVLAFDDGYLSLNEVLPWLKTQKIPAVLFINAKYLDGKSYRKNPNEKYLTYNDLFALNHAFIEIGSHGFEHTDASIMSKEEFAMHIENNVEILHTHPCYIPFHAYTWGRHNDMTDKMLKSKHIIPVYIDGMKNYNQLIIHRELL